MTFVITHGADHIVDRRQTASEALGLVLILQARKEPVLKITDESGAEITLLDLEKRHKSQVELSSAASQIGSRSVADPLLITSRPLDDKPTRRDWLYVATGAAGAMVLTASIVPLIDQMNPDASTVAGGEPIDLDLGRVEPGKQVVVRWRGRPIFVVFRTPEMLEALKDPRLLDELVDPQSKQVQQPPYAENWHRSLSPEIGVFVGVCTHLGCIPEFESIGSAAEAALNQTGGYFCPCHGSLYDLAGRVFRDVPAPFNLPVPPYHFLSETVLRIGENPPNSNFDFSTIRQV